MSTNLESIILDQSTSHEITTGVGLSEIAKLEIKKRVGKRLKQALREAGFSKQY